MSNKQRDLVADLERCRRVAAYGATVAYSSSNKEAEELHGDMFGMLLHALPRAIRAEARVKELTEFMRMVEEAAENEQTLGRAGAEDSRSEGGETRWG